MDFFNDYGIYDLNSASLEEKKELDPVTTGAVVGGGAAIGALSGVIAGALINRHAKRVIDGVGWRNSYPMDTRGLKEFIESFGMRKAQLANNYAFYLISKYNGATPNRNTFYLKKLKRDITINRVLDFRPRSQVLNKPYVFNTALQIIRDKRYIPIMLADGENYICTYFPRGRNIEFGKRLVYFDTETYMAYPLLRGGIIRSTSSIPRFLSKLV